MMEVVVTTGDISRAKLQSNRHHNKPTPSVVTGQMPFLSPNQQYQSTEGNVALLYAIYILKRFLIKSLQCLQ